MPGAHHIHRQQLVLEAPGLVPAEAAKWHRRLQALEREVVRPALLRQLDRLAPGEEEIVIDRVEVEISLGSVEDLRRAVGRDFERLLGETLEQRVEGRHPMSTSDVGDVLRHFLRYGNLSWPYALGDRFAAAVEKWLASAGPEEWNEIFRLASADVIAFLGRATQVPAFFLAEACAAMVAMLPAESAKTSLPVLRAGSANGEGVKAWREALAAAGFAVKQELPAGPPTSDLHARAPRDRMSVPAEEQEAYYPENTGIVILHPYLKWWLDRVELRAPPNTAKGFGRAAALLHYAATGLDSPAEWDLPLTKVLLGHEPEDFLPLANGLTEEDRAMTDEFLAGIIGHWPALGSTSIDGLREGFLARPGKLGRERGGWRLTVEDRAHDMLLDKLPWALSPVKTPWMEGLLQVDWR